MANRPRPKRAFVAARLHLSNAEIAQQSVAAGLNMNTRHVRSHRFALKHQGITESQPDLDSTPAPAKRKRATKRAAPSSDAPDPKEGQFRRLVFELGFDRARKLWLQIQELHDRMKGET